MNHRKNFTTLLAITRLLDFWVHYPTLTYPKLKNHYPSGPGRDALGNTSPSGVKISRGPCGAKSPPVVLRGCISQHIPLGSVWMQWNTKYEIQIQASAKECSVYIFSLCKLIRSPVRLLNCNVISVETQVCAANPFFLCNITFMAKTFDHNS